MNFKQMIGLVLLSLGVVVIVLAFHNMGYVPEKVLKMKQVTSSPISPTEHMPDNAPIHVEPSTAHGSFVLIGGIVLFLSGAWVAVRFRDSYG